VHDRKADGFHRRELAAAGNNVYFYNQNQSMLQPLLHRSGAYGYGVVHTAELVYVFGNLSKFDIPT
jgi:carboxylesterase type B